LFLLQHVGELGGGFAAAHREIGFATAFAVELGAEGRYDFAGLLRDTFSTT